jgi:plasmid stabilization system protein ParE
MRKLVFTQYADAQFSDAYQWYEAARAGLGEEFTQAVNDALTRIAGHPAQFKIAIADYRRLAVKRFPYEVFYSFDDRQIIVYAVFHTSQQPSAWQSQLN